MSKLTQLRQWQALEKHHQDISNISLIDLFAQDAQRFEHYSMECCGLLLDYSKNHVTQKTLELFQQLAQAQQLGEQIQAMFRGELINQSEARAALHTALRKPTTEVLHVNGENVMESIKQSHDAVAHICQSLHQSMWYGFSGKPITDIVNIGIGGSDLGPAMVYQALTPYHKKNIECHFVSNIDGHHIQQTLKHLNPETTLFIVASKSFSTTETITNANTAKQWLLQAGASNDKLSEQFIAITANAEKARHFGIHDNHILPMWDWVGGRYSLWSAIGLPIAIGIGMDQFQELLAGAHAMDQHFANSDLEYNMPVIMAFISLWYNHFFGAQSYAILPYSHYLQKLPSYLQQAEMESNGKSVTHSGDAVTYSTSPIVWGGVGSNGQHAFHQLLHQGTHIIPADFILPLTSKHDFDQHHEWLVANCLSQSQALLQGKSEAEALQALLKQGLEESQAMKLAKQQAIPGNRPSNTLLIPELNPYHLGALIALYEHKIFVQGALWQINSFDQWGVELGKQLAKNILPQLSNACADIQFDASTKGLIAHYHKITKDTHGQT